MNSNYYTFILHLYCNKYSFTLAITTLILISSNYSIAQCNRNLFQYLKSDRNYGLSSLIQYLSFLINIKLTSMKIINSLESSKSKLNHKYKPMPMAYLELLLNKCPNQ